MVAGGAKDVIQPQLAFANSAREGGRHYATGCHHFHLHTMCWILDPMIDPIIDVMINIEPNEQTILQVRHVRKHDNLSKVKGIDDNALELSPSI